ncbi:MAG: FAD-binding oxidoreductase [Alphaproteobacteria bacterium]|nr:FAD-binding oxidoreductase [Alphaproteobacteria bacterium]
MPINREDTRWNGWGWVKAHSPVEGRDAVWEWIAAALQVPALPHTPAKALDEVRFADSRLVGAARDELGEGIGGANVRDSAYERAAHARGKSYLDLLHLRAGNLSDAPDAVVYPHSSDDVVRLLRWAEQHRVAVVPFAGGSSVVGGLTGSAPEFSASIALDLTEMNRFIGLDEVSLLATAEAGIYGVDFEAALAAKGFKHGHHPQSFEFSTLGGWIAARGAGQQSNRYGRAEDWFAGGEVATSKGVWTLPALPASAAGPDLRALIAGSEGAFGVITSATVRVHRQPEASDYRAFLFADFASGASALRRMIQADVPVATMRLSNPDETFFYQALAKAGQVPGFKDRLQAQYLKTMGMGERPCALILGFEGERELVSYGSKAAQRVLRSCGGISVGRGPAKRWYQGRFHGPYSRDPMMDRGLGVDTLETATTWSNVERLCTDVRGALLGAMQASAPVKGARGLVFAHISHSYVDGASLYFTYIFPRNLNDEIGQWRAIKTAASDAIVRAGGTISHHHGVGEDHMAWLEAEKGAQGMSLLRAIKREMDPAGVLNPGKLVSTSTGPIARD